MRTQIAVGAVVLVAALASAASPAFGAGSLDRFSKFTKCVGQFKAYGYPNTSDNDWNKSDAQFGAWEACKGALHEA